ncbi:MAG: P-II family nitrogen regulator [Methanotrichaceae archaeon]|nr:P-II family nitrogen regulator [Methanotrichaceae archaeon]
MKMIWAVVRPEMVDRVVGALGDEGYAAVTRFDVYGRGKQKGVEVHGLNYDVPKTMLMMVLEDERVEEAVRIIKDHAKTGNIGDGRIFVASIEEAHTIRTGEMGL